MFRFIQLQLGKYWVVTNLFQGQHGQQHPTTTVTYSSDNGAVGGGGATYTQTSIAGVPSSTLVRAISTTASATGAASTSTGVTKSSSEAVTSSSAGTLQIPQATQMLSQAAIGQQLPNGTIITTQAAQQQRHVADHQQQQLQHVHGES